jgi:hypothetical protein
MDSDPCGGNIPHIQTHPKGRYFQGMIQTNKKEVTHMAFINTSLIVAFQVSRFFPYRDSHYDQDRTIFGYSFVNGEWISEFKTEFFKEQDFKIDQILIGPGRWLLVVISNMSLHVWVNPSATAPIIVLLTIKTLDNIYFVKRGQDLIALDSQEGEIDIISIATLTLRFS